MKKIIVLILTLVLIVSSVSVLVVMAGASSPVPEMNIAYCNLSFQNSVCIKYAVNSNVSNAKILIWTSPRTEYTVGTQDGEITDYVTENIGGTPHMIFDYTALVAKQMTDVVYARAYSRVDGVDYYSEINKYSILQYAYNKLGKTGTASTDTELKEMLTHMLAYGAAAQKYLDDYKADRLATADWYQVKLTAGVLDDGCTHGLYLPGDQVTMTAPATDADGAPFAFWSDSKGNQVAITATYELTVGNVNEVYTPTYVKAPCVTHSYEEISRVDAQALRDGIVTFACLHCGDSYTETIPATKSLKILALGNSFTVDGTQHLWNICKDGGVETVIVGNLYIGDCTLDTHWSNIEGSAASYTYYKNTSGTWSTTKNYRVIDALRQEDWDYIVLHQTAGSAGFAENFSHLDDIIGFMNENKTNPDAKIVWHMPWAYQSDSTHKEFPKYDSDQMKMYGEITARVQELILTRDTVSAVIPSGTAIQNLRTSYIGDTLTRDGYHLSYSFGRYTASLAWYHILTGGDIDTIDWLPAQYPEVQCYLPAMRDAVKSAIHTPFAVTRSAYPESDFPIGNYTPSDPMDPSTYLEGDKALAEAFGVELEGYRLLPWAYLENSYWMCTSKTTTETPGSSSSTYRQNICTNRMFSIENELPVGTVFICDPGWRYRMEIFPSQTEVYKGTRPEGSTAPLYVLSEDFLNGCNYIAWAVSANPKRDISANYAEAYAHVRIYIPEEYYPTEDSRFEEDKALAESYGVDLNDYELLSWEYVENAYWICTSKTTIHKPGSSSSTYRQNVCTDRMYSVANEVPVGTIFICDPGWRYLLEIFPSETEFYKGTRPAGITDPFYVLTEEFLDGCTYLAWDVSSYPKSDISAIYEEAATHIRVYVPVER